MLRVQTALAASYILAVYHFYVVLGCCIYEKPHRFDESDSEESDDECEHCFGHVERKHKKHQHITSTEVQVNVEK